MTDAGHRALAGVGKAQQSRLSARYATSSDHPVSLQCAGRTAVRSSPPGGLADGAVRVFAAWKHCLLACGYLVAVDAVDDDRFRIETCDMASNASRDLTRR
jgi:hypothetical protein